MSPLFSWVDRSLTRLGTAMGVVVGLGGVFGLFPGFLLGEWVTEHVGIQVYFRADDMAVPQEFRGICVRT